jgi:hypothetical protein
VTVPGLQVDTRLPAFTVAAQPVRRRAPFLVVVLPAAATAALLRGSADPPARASSSRLGSPEDQVEHLHDLAAEGASIDRSQPARDRTPALFWAGVR